MGWLQSRPRGSSALRKLAYGCSDTTLDRYFRHLEHVGSSEDPASDPIHNSEQRLSLSEWLTTSDKEFQVRLVRVVILQQCGIVLSHPQDRRWQ